MPIPVICPCLTILLAGKLCDFLRLRCQPAQFKLHRADLAQCRVKPAMVVECQIVNHLVHGLPAC